MNPKFTMNAVCANEHRTSYVHAHTYIWHICCFISCLLSFSLNVLYICIKFNNFFHLVLLFRPLEWTLCDSKYVQLVVVIKPYSSEFIFRWNIKYILYIVKRKTRIASNRSLNQPLRFFFSIHIYSVIIIMRAQKYCQKTCSKNGIQ